MEERKAEGAEEQVERLHNAIVNYQLEEVAAMLTADPSLINLEHSHVVREDITRTTTFRTPLGTAVQAGHLEMVKLLLERGADPNLPIRTDWFCDWHGDHSAGGGEDRQPLLSTRMLALCPEQTSESLMGQLEGIENDEMLWLLLQYGASLPVMTTHQWLSTPQRRDLLVHLVRGRERPTTGKIYFTTKQLYINLQHNTHIDNITT